MALWALGLYALYLALAFGGRTLLQLRRTGSTGFKGISGRPLSAEWTGGVLFVAAFLLGLAGPVLGLVGALEPVALLDGSVGHALGFVLFFAGLAGTLLAQMAMGASWRIGVDEAERTELVTAGPFALVRNPIFSAMVPAFLGLALLVPNAASLVGFAALVVRARGPGAAGRGAIPAANARRPLLRLRLAGRALRAWRRALVGPQGSLRRRESPEEIYNYKVSARLWEAITVMDMNGMMESCMNMMGSMMDGGMMGMGVIMFVVLGLLFFLVRGLALVGGLGYLAVRRLRAY